MSKEKNNRFVDVLMQALIKKNLEGFDYMEYKQSVTKLRELGIDEDTAIRSAYTTGSTVGLTKDKLIKTARYYTEVLQEQKEHFLRSLNKHQAEKVEDRAKETGELKKKIANWETKIEQLQKEIAKARNIIENSESEIDEARQKAQANKKSFDEALKMLISKIEEDVEAINRVIE